MTQSRILDGKRIGGDALQGMKAEVDASVAAGQRRVGPVAYTQLDVYKRQ